MIEIERTYTFEAAHFLPKAPEGHKCKAMHGHSYTVTVGIRGMPSEAGWIVDFAEVDAACGPTIKELDHTVLNDRVVNPTSENLAMWLFHNLKIAISARGSYSWREDAVLVWVRVSETTRSAATYRP